MENKVNIKALSKSLLENWIAQETGEGLYKFTGGFWEVLYPILKKYQPELLRKYENLLGEEFNNFNEKVKEIYDSFDEEQNIINAINYMNEKMRYSTANEIQLIDIGDDELLPYLPNQNIDSKQYWGRDVE